MVSGFAALLAKMHEFRIFQRVYTVNANAILMALLRTKALLCSFLIHLIVLLRVVNLKPDVDGDIAKISK